MMVVIIMFVMLMVCTFYRCEAIWGTRVNGLPTVLQPTVFAMVVAVSARKDFMKIPKGFSANRSVRRFFMESFYL